MPLSSPERGKSSNTSTDNTGSQNQSQQHDSSTTSTPLTLSGDAPIQPHVSSQSSSSSYSQDNVSQNFKPTLELDTRFSTSFNTNSPLPSTRDLQPQIQEQKTQSLPQKLSINTFRPSQEPVKISSLIDAPRPPESFDPSIPETSYTTATKTNFKEDTTPTIPVSGILDQNPQPPSKQSSSSNVLASSPQSQTGVGQSDFSTATRHNALPSSSIDTPVRTTPSPRGSSSASNSPNFNSSMFNRRKSMPSILHSPQSTHQSGYNQHAPPRHLIEKLRQFSLFNSAPESFLNAIASKLRPLHVSAQEFIITEGEEARAMYWILRGSVGIVSLDGESVHAELGPGAFFGEIGILFDRPRTASVQTRTKCLLVVLTAEALNEVLPSYPDIERLIRDEAQERLSVLEKNRKAKAETTVNKPPQQNSHSQQSLESSSTFTRSYQTKFEQTNNNNTENNNNDNNINSSAAGSGNTLGMSNVLPSPSNVDSFNLSAKSRKQSVVPPPLSPATTPVTENAPTSRLCPRQTFPKLESSNAASSSVQPSPATTTPTTNYVSRRSSIGDHIYLENTRVRQLLEEVSPFADLPNHILHKLALTLEPQSYPPFQNIITQGKPGKDIYFILDGKVEVIDEAAGNTTLARLSRGAYFGEMSFLSLAPLRTATVRTISEVDCLVLTEKSLDAICLEYPDIQRKIETTAKQRLDINQSHQSSTNTYNTINELGDPLYTNSTSSIPSTNASTPENESNNNQNTTEETGVDTLYLHKHRNRHSSVSTSSSSDHGNSLDLKVKPLDQDPFAVTRGDRHKEHDESLEGEDGVGLFSKSWNTAGMFDTALRPPVPEETLDPMDPRSPENSNFGNPENVSEVSSPVFKESFMSFSNDNSAFKPVNFAGRRSSITQQQQQQQSQSPSQQQSPISPSFSNPFGGASSSLEQGPIDPYHTQSNDDPVQASNESIDPANRQTRPHQPFSDQQQQVMALNDPFQQPQQYHYSIPQHQQPLQSALIQPGSGYPSRRNSKSVSLAIPEEDSVVEPESNLIIPTSESFDNLNNRRRRFSQTTPSSAPPPALAGIGGFLLHPRAKKARYGSRRRSSLFNIGPFPDMIQLKIFQYLNIKELMRLRRVCQHWRQILQSSSNLMKVLDLTEFNTTITDKSIVQITNFVGTRPKIVDISNCFHLTDEGFSYLVNGIGLAKIQVFKMKSVWEVSGMAIIDLTVPSIGSDLKEIDLSNCRKVGDSTLSRLIGWVVPPQQYQPGDPNYVSTPDNNNQYMQPGTVVGCPKLTKISLSYCKHITDRSMYHMAMFASDRLEYLNLTRCTSITDHGFSYWALRHFTSLTYLCLADCTFLTDKAIMSIASAAKHLESLILSFCCALTDVSVEVLALGCPALKTLNLAFCGSAVSDASLTAVSLHLIELQSLSVRGCIRVTAAGINRLLTDCHRLQYLDITQCRNVSGPLAIPASIRLHSLNDDDDDDDDDVEDDAIVTSLARSSSNDVSALSLRSTSLTQGRPKRPKSQKLYELKDGSPSPFSHTAHPAHSSKSNIIQHISNTSPELIAQRRHEKEQQILRRRTRSQQLQLRRSIIQNATSARAVAAAVASASSTTTQQQQQQTFSPLHHENTNTQTDYFDQQQQQQQQQHAPPPPPPQFQPTFQNPFSQELYPQQPSSPGHQLPLPHQQPTSPSNPGNNNQPHQPHPPPPPPPPHNYRQ